MDGEQLAYIEGSHPVSFSSTTTAIEKRVWDQQNIDYLDKELGIGEYHDIEKEIQNNVADIIPSGIGYQTSGSFCVTSLGIAGACIGTSIEVGYIFASNQPYVSVDMNWNLLAGTPVVGFELGGGPVIHHNVTNVHDLGGYESVFEADVGGSAVVADVSLGAEVSYSMDEEGNYQTNPNTGNRIWSWGPSASVGLGFETPGVTAHVGAGNSFNAIYWSPWGP